MIPGGAGPFGSIYLISVSFAVLGGWLIAVIGDSHTRLVFRALAFLGIIAAFLWAVYRCNALVSHG